MIFKNFFFIYILLIYSCSFDHEEQIISNVSLQCTLSGVESTTKSKTANSTNGNVGAPAYISGVTFMVENLEYDVNDVLRDFYFNEPNDLTEDKNSLSLDNLTVGRNRITAKGICENKAENIYYECIPFFESQDLNERANYYFNYLREIHPTYADYVINSPIVKELSSDKSKNVVTVEMTTNSHRLAVVIENPDDSNYILKVSVEENGGGILLESANFIKIGTQDALVINNIDAFGDKLYLVKVRYFTKDSNIEILDKTLVKTINSSEGSNTTKLYHFAKNGLLESDNDLFLAWNNINTIISGEEIE